MRTAAARDLSPPGFEISHVKQKGPAAEPRRRESAETHPGGQCRGLLIASQVRVAN